LFFLNLNVHIVFKYRSMLSFATSSSNLVPDCFMQFSGFPYIVEDYVWC